MSPIVSFAMLTLGVHHGDDIPADATSRTWFALVEGGDSPWSLQRVDVTIETVQDQMLDPDEGPFTGREVKTSKVDGTVRILLSGNLTPGPIPVPQGDLKPLWPGQSQTFRLARQSLGVVAYGEVPRPKGAMAYLASYGLAATAHGSKESITLFEGVTDDTHPRVWFVGDLDRDGALDLIVDTAYKYSFQEWTLFLSSPTPGPSLKNVAIFRAYGC